MVEETMLIVTLVAERYGLTLVNDLSFQFDFVNCFLSLFYVAFYLQDLKLLRSVSNTRRQ